MPDDGERVRDGEPAPAPRYDDYVRPEPAADKPADRLRPEPPSGTKAGPWKVEPLFSLADKLGAVGLLGAGTLLAWLHDFNDFASLKVVGSFLAAVVVLRLLARAFVNALPPLPGQLKPRERFQQIGDTLVLYAIGLAVGVTALGIAMRANGGQARYFMEGYIGAGCLGFAAIVCHLVGALREGLQRKNDP